jgi:surfactin family lipopeptide synthetase C
VKKKIKDIYPLSPMQQGMLFHSLYAPTEQTYVTQMGCRLVGELHIAEFEHAWQQVIDRHPILRTAFVWERRAEPLQIVFQDVQLSWLHEDWQELTAAQQQEALNTFMEANQARAFELSRPPLIRPALIRLTENTSYLIL